MSILKRFSYSGLQSYKKCPAQFQFRYVDKIRKTDEGIEAFMGKRVHEAIEFLYKEIQDGKIPFIDNILIHYEDKWNEKWHDRIAIVKRGETSDQYFQLGLDCIARFYRKNQPFGENVIGIELEMDFDLDDDPNYRMKGIMDRLDQIGNDDYEIHDYKTGKRAMDQISADRDGQLAVYQIALKQQKENVREVELVWHFVRHGIEIRSKRSRSQLDQLTKNLKSQIDEIRAHERSGEPFPPKESILCNWCHYWEECPAKQSSNPYIGS